MPTSGPVITVCIPQELLDRVEDFRFQHRFPNRSQAILWLLRAAFDAELRPDK